MTTATATATANLSVLFADFCRSQGIDPTTVKGFKFQSPEYSVSSGEPVTVKESAHVAYDAEPVEVVTPRDANGKPISEYRYLQAQCKALGIKANGSTNALKVRLDLHNQGILAADEYTKVKVSKPRAAKTAKVKEACFGLNYRQTQRLVKWFKDNMPSNLLPADLAKNTGWANVKANAERCLTSHGWAAKLNDKQVQMLTDYIGIIDGDQLVTFLEESGLA